MGLMDIVEFVEKVCEFSLTDFQKEFVRKVYDAAKNDKRLYYVPPRCNQKFSFELLQAIVIIIVGKERGLVKGEEMILEGKTVTDYEYLFSMNLQAKLKEKIQGAIYVKGNENDSLVIKVTRRAICANFIPHLSNLNIIPAYSTCRRHSDQLFIPLSEYFCYPDTPSESLL